MRDLHNRSVAGILYANLVLCVQAAMLTALVSSCSTNLPVQREAQQAEQSGLAPLYSIIWVIHGDGDYLYHDTSGTEYNADEEALAGAKRVALQNPRAEVFIFHQQPRRHFLFFVPLRDGAFSYYRNGKLIANELYWRDQKESQLGPEVELYRRFCEDDQRERVRLFVYCGHEIPEFAVPGYDASYPDRMFTVQDLASGVKGFTRHAAKFDLMVLSSCFGGTPYTIGALGPFARTIIASPENLHLSYFDFHSLERLDHRVRDGDVPEFARQFARHAFDRLRREIQTAVSIAVYDVDRVQEYVRSVDCIYALTLTTLKEKAQVSRPAIEHCDCADLPAYTLPTMNVGVEVFYRPASFGRLRNKLNHSGWECLRIIEPQSPTSQTGEPVLKPIR